MYESLFDYDAIPAAARVNAQRKSASKKVLAVFLLLVGISVFGYFADSAKYGQMGSQGLIGASSHDTCSAGTDTEVSDSETLLCYRFANLELQNNQHIATVPLQLTGQIISMTLTINKLSHGWTNILHFGTESQTRQPLIGMNKDGLRVAFSGGVEQYEEREAASFSNVPLGEKFQLRVIRKELDARIYVGSEEIGQIQLDAEDFTADCAETVYASRGSPSDVTIEDLVICPFYDEYFEDKVTEPVEDLPQGEIQPFGAIGQPTFGDVIGSIGISKEGLSVYLKMTIHELSDDWTNILSIGDDEKQRQPAIHLNRDGLRVAFAGEDFSERNAFSYEVPVGQEIVVQVIRQEYEVTVVVNGDELDKFPLEEDDVLVSCSPHLIWCSHDLHPPSDVTIHDLVISNFGTTPACPPTPPPTEQPSFSPTKRPTRKPTEQPTKKPTNHPTVKPTEQTGAPTPTIPDGHCLLYANSAGGKVERDTSVGTVDVTENFELSFKVTVNALSEDWASIVHVGSVNEERQPGIWLCSGNRQQLHFTMNDVKAEWRQDIVDLDIELHREYDIRVSVRGLSASIYFDGVLKHELTLEEETRLEREDVPLYVGDPWYIPADAVVTDLHYCSETSGGNGGGGKSLCQEYDGGRIVRNKQVFDVKYTEVMDVQFYVKMDQGSAYGNVIQLGGSEGDEWPGIFFGHSYPHPNFLDVQFQNSQNGADATQYARQVEVTPDEWHLMRVLMNGEHVTIYLDGEQQFEYYVPENYKPTVKKMPVYASGDWNDAASGMIGVLRVCNYEDPDPLVPPGDVCQEFEGGSQLSRDNTLFTTAVTQVMSLEFAVTVNQLEDDWASIVHVGEINEERQPGIWLHAGRESLLHFTFSADGSWSGSGQDVVNLPIELNTEYQVLVTMYEDRAKVFIDGVLKEVLQLESDDRQYKDATPVYAADPWYIPSNAVVKNLKLCSQKQDTLQTTPVPADCRAYATGQWTGLPQNNHVLTTAVTTNLDLSFMVKVNSLSSDWRSIVHVGSVNEERQPGIWLCDGNRQKLHFTFNYGEDWQQQVADLDFPLGVEFEVKVSIRDHDAWIFLGGALAKFLSLDSDDRQLRGGVPVYAADPWYAPADAVIKDLKICYGDGTTPEPTTKRPTEHPTKRPTGNPTPQPSGCQTYSGEISKGKKAFDSTRVDRDMIVEMYFRVEPCILPGAGNMVQIGDHDDNEWPMIFYDGGAVTVQFESQRSSEHYAKPLTPIDKDRWYKLRVEIEAASRACKIFLDGRQAHPTFTIPAEFQPLGVQSWPVYASNPWDNAAIGEISSLQVCQGGAEPAYSKDPDCLYWDGEHVLQENHKVGEVWFAHRLVIEFEFYPESTATKVKAAFGAPPAPPAPAPPANPPAPPAPAPPANPPAPPAPAPPAAPPAPVAPAKPSSGNVIQIGDVLQDAWPRVDYQDNPGEGNDQIIVHWERKLKPHFSSAYKINPRQWNKVKIEVNFVFATVWVNDDLKAPFYVHKSCIPELPMYPLFAAAPGHWKPQANGKIKNLKVCPYYWW